MKRRIGAEDSFPAAVVTSKDRRLIFETEPGIKVPGIVFPPKEPKDALRILFVHGGGKTRDLGAIEKWTAGGHGVVAVDLRGMGETEPEAPHRGLSNFFTPEWKEAYISFNMNRPLLGQRVRDLLSVVGAIDQDGRGVHVVAVGAAAPVALHAALLDPRDPRADAGGHGDLLTAGDVGDHDQPAVNVVPGSAEVLRSAGPGGGAGSASARDRLAQGSGRRGGLAGGPR